MTRAWDEFVARVFDVVPPGLLLLLLIAVAGLAGVFWYSWPAWLPKRRAKSVVIEFAEKADEKPEETRPATTDEADRLAAEGRYAEAIRHRLRVTLRELVAADLVPPQPGWTAAELTVIAGDQRPAVSAPLTGATNLFSEIWYGDRPAEHAHDQRMRMLTDQVRAAL